MSRHDEGLYRLLDLDGFVAEVGGGFWVKIAAHRVPPDERRPYGVGYTLTLHDSSGQRVFGIDNAHIVRLTRGPAGRSSTARDHLHLGESVRQYLYRDADTLMDDFWREVEAILKREGVE
jgi:hypothetical protein